MVRTALPEDVPAITRIENEAIASGFAHFGVEPMTCEEMAAKLAAAGAAHPWLVADLEGNVVGFARAGRWKERAGYQWTVEIGVYVDAAHQRHGHGAALYEELFNRLAAGGVRTVLAGIALPNEGSVLLHEAFGMVCIGVMPRCGFKDGAWRDVGYWIRHLGDPELAPHPDKTTLS